MKICITASIPTVHQLDSLRSLNLPVESNPDGSFEIRYECPNVEYARDWLQTRLHNLYNNDRIDYEEYSNSNKSLFEDNYIRINGITVNIEEVN